MIQLITTILIRVTITGIVSSIAISVAKGSAVSEVVNIGCGLLMVVAFMQPLSQIQLPRLQDVFARSEVSVQDIQEENTATTLGSIGAALGQVMQEHAEEQGISCTFVVSVAQDDAGVLEVDRVTVYHSPTDAGRLSDIAAIIESDCSVGAERQVYIEK